MVNISPIQQTLEHWFITYFCMTPTYFFQNDSAQPKILFYFVSSFKGRRVENATFQEFCRSSAILKSVLLASVVWYCGR